MTDPKDAVDTLRNKLDAGDRGGSDRDRDILLDFSDELKLRREDYGWHRHEKLLRHCVRMSEESDAALSETLIKEHGGEVDDEETFYACKEAAKTIVRWIHDTYDVEDGSQETNRDYRVAFRMFAKHVTRDDEVPDTHEWISTKTTRDYDPAPDEADMLRLEQDVKPMREAARNTRDAALFMLQFEGGFRGGELYDMTVGQITDGEHSIKARVDGKRGEHDVHLILAVPYINQWINNHPGGDDDYLWSKLNDPDRVSYQMFLKCFRDSAERAGVDRPVTPTNFRKSNAYWLACRGKSQAFIEDRQGRARGSPVISRYVAQFSGETQEMEYAAMHGIEGVELEDKDDTQPPVVCLRCGDKTPVEKDFCIHCNMALDLEAKHLLDEVGSKLDELAVSSDDVDTRRDALRARRSLRENPAAVDEDDLHQLLSSLSADAAD